MSFGIARRTVAVVAAAVSSLAVVGAAQPVAASDAFHDCSQLDDGVEYTYDPVKGTLKTSKGASVTFRRIDRTRLKVLSGYCNTKQGRYRFNTEVYGVTLEIPSPEGSKAEAKKVRFRCEDIRDETPAGQTCTREVKILDSTAPDSVFEKYR